MTTVSPPTTARRLAAPPVHVERTDDPATLRWVCHEPALVQVMAAAATADDGDGPLARLLGDVLAEVQAQGGDLLVGVADADRWPWVSGLVHDAVLAALDDARHHPFAETPVPAAATPPAIEPAAIEPAAIEPAAIEPPAVEPPTVDQVQAAVDRVAGPVATDHGGRIEVVGVDASQVRVRLDGACRGCARSSDTLSRLVTTAVERAHPSADVVVEDGCSDVVPRTRLAWPRRRR